MAIAGRVRERAIERVTREFLDEVAIRREDERRGIGHERQFGLARREEHSEQHQQQDEVQDLAQSVEGEPDALQYGPQRMEHGHPPQPPSFSSMRADLPERSRR